MAAKQLIHYFHFGCIETGRYRWTQGYCEVTPSGYLVPPQTMRQAQSSAKEQGAQAVFHESEHLARIAANFPTPKES